MYLFVQKWLLPSPRHPEPNTGEPACSVACSQVVLSVLVPVYHS